MSTMSRINLDKTTLQKCDPCHLNQCTNMPCHRRPPRMEKDNPKLKIRTIIFFFSLKNLLSQLLSTMFPESTADEYGLSETKTSMSVKVFLFPGSLGSKLNVNPSRYLDSPMSIWIQGPAWVVLVSKVDENILSQRSSFSLACEASSWLITSKLATSAGSGFLETEIFRWTKRAWISWNEMMLHFVVVSFRPSVWQRVMYFPVQGTPLKTPSYTRAQSERAIGCQLYLTVYLR